MINRFFRRWEERLADVNTSRRVVRPFEWGLDWIPANGTPRDGAPDLVLRAWVDHVMADTDAFFTPPPTNDYAFAPGDPSSTDGETGTLTFPSALTTPHP